VRFLSLFSGIEAASVAWKPLGWECVGVAEIEPFPCAVLAHHYPDIPNLGDITRITEEQIKVLGPIDLVVGGFPCQDVSVAGKRKGLKDEQGKVTRSGLFFDAMRVVGWANPRWLVIENVPGLFSTHGGRDFASVVGEMAGCEFDIPRGGWQSAGAALGPNGLVEWSVLDAQWFGVPQRRRRIFLVRDSGDWSGRPPVLLERESLLGNPPPSRKAGKGVTAGTLRSANGGSDVDHARSEHLIPGCIGHLTRRYSNVCGAPEVDGGLFLPVAHSLRGEGFDASEDGTGRGTPLVPVLASTLKANNDGGGFGSDPSETFILVAIQERAVSENIESGPQGKGYQEHIAYTLEARNKSQAVVFQCQGGSVGEMGALRAGNCSHTGGIPFIAFDTTQITSRTNRSNPKPGDPCHPIAAGTHAPAIAYRTNAAGQVDEQGDKAAALTTQTDPCTQFVAFSCKDYGADVADTAPTLRAMNHSGSHANAGGQVAVAVERWGMACDCGHTFVGALSDPCPSCGEIRGGETRGDPIAFDLRGRKGGSLPEGYHDSANIRAANGGSSRSYIAAPMAVRRLTPVECARLQGFPDDYLAQVPWRGKATPPDGPMYKALGNSFAVPCVRWIGQRIKMAEAMGKDVAA
jgi:DNA (cytosine-5)-methyltransferase 1